MFVKMSVLEMLIPFAIFGFVVFIVVLWKYSFRFGEWAAAAIIAKFFTKKETHTNMSEVVNEDNVICDGDIEYGRQVVLMSDPPKYGGKCKKCGTTVYSLCSNVD